jgi:hypothetical protein
MRVIPSLLAALILGTFAPTWAADTTTSGMVPLVHASGPLAGMGESYHLIPEGEQADPSWQPPPGYSSLPLRAVYGEFPDAYQSRPGRWSYLAGRWESSRPDASQPGGYRPPTAAELRAEYCEVARLGMRAQALAHRRATYDDLALGECQVDIPSPEYCQQMRASMLALAQWSQTQTAALANTTTHPDAAACRAWVAQSLPAMGGAQ